MTALARLPDAASLETVLAALDPASADSDLVPALTAAFPGFAFGIAPIDDNYWRHPICASSRRHWIASSARPSAGSSMMTHGHWVDPDVGLAIAQGLKAQRVVLLRWADRSYGF
jgi:hypothetical protein